MRHRAEKVNVFGRGWGRGGRTGGGIIIVSRMAAVRTRGTIDPRIPIMLGWSISGFYRPGRGEGGGVFSFRGIIVRIGAWDGAGRSNKNVNISHRAHIQSEVARAVQEIGRGMTID